MVVDPQQELTTEQFRKFIQYYLNEGYIFISPNDIIKGLDPEINHILITFDDGYFNNSKAIPVLEEYKVPAVFFISSNHILEQKSFWWDVIYRERMKQGIEKDAIMAEVVIQKAKRNNEIEDYLTKTFGRNALNPVCDIDRPFTPDELRDFASNKYVYIGNHTHNHAILTNYNLDEVREEIGAAQLAIAEMTGVTPIFISYPNGNVSLPIVKVSRELGLELGITTVERKNSLPIDFNNLKQFLLDRFILWGTSDIVRQCTAFRSDIQLITTIKQFKKGRVA